MFRRRRKPEDFAAEIESHLALEATHLGEQGLNQAQARTAAKRTFGNTTLAAERFYERNRWIWLDSLVVDVRHTVRSLRKAPGFTATVLAALALGIGANTAMFTVIKTVLLDQLPYPDPNRIVNIGRPGNDSSTNMPRFASLQQNNPGFEDLAAWHTGATMNLSGGDRPESVKVITASQNYFNLFGAHPALGRTFTKVEDSPGGPAVLVMSYGLWQRRFGGRSSILGQSITLGGAPYTVIGVLSPAFQPYSAAEVWVPLQPDPNSTNLASILTVCARLPPNITLAQANSWVAVIGKRYLQTHPSQIETSQKIQVAFLQRQITGDIRPALLILMGSVGLVLLIACANVANLLMARAASRQREIAIRAAIGAGRRRILRQLLTESFMLVLAGGALGLALGSWGVRALLALTPGDLPRLPEITAIPVIDPKVAAFSFLLSLITGLLFGLAPAWQLSSAELTPSLNESGLRTGPSRKQNRTRSALVAVEVAIAVILLCGAVLLIRSFAAMHSVNLGFDPDHLLTVQLSLAGDGYAESSRVDRLARDLVERTKNLPGWNPRPWRVRCRSGAKWTCSSVFPDTFPPAASPMAMCSGVLFPPTTSASCGFHCSPEGCCRSKNPAAPSSSASPWRAGTGRARIRSVRRSSSAPASALSIRPDWPRSSVSSAMSASGCSSILLRSCIRCRRKFPMRIWRFSMVTNPRPC